MLKVCKLCNIMDMDSMPGSGEIMRRKNLYVTVSLLLVLFFVHSMDIPLVRSLLEGVCTEEKSTGFFSGKIIRMEKEDDGGWQLEVRVDYCDYKKLKRRESILIRCSVDESEPVSPENVFRRKVYFHASLQEPQGRRNPGCFDYSLYLKSRNIFYTSEVSWNSLEFSGRMPGKADRLAAWLVGKRFDFAQSLNPVSAGLVSGILFGDTSVLSEEVYQQFRNNGTAHILAVSGLHIGILYGLYRKTAGKRRNPAAMSLLALGIFCYGTISMWSPSVIRASMMIGLHLLAEVLDLRYDMTTGLCTVALMLILNNPYVIFNAGFQMSFLAIASICFFTPVLPRKIPDSLRTMVSVNLGLLLYQMFQFNYISLVSLAANIPAVYLTGILVPAALLCFVGYIFLGTVPMEFLLDSLCHLLLEINRLSALGGRGSMEVPSPPVWFLVSSCLLLFYLASEQSLVLRLRRKRRRFCAVICCCFLAGILFSTLLTSPVSGADIVFVDVGQGDCVHIRDGRSNVLIDGGGSVRYNTGEGTLKPYLLKNGVRNVDLALATHQHMDHYQGLLELEEVYPVKKILTGLTAGENIRISEDVFIETLWPAELDPEKGQEENRLCSVFMIHYEGWKILVTGDLDEAGEMEMMAYYKNRGEGERLKADILKVGHHGSRTSTCGEFLDCVSPEVAVIQVGVYNIYGHPHTKTVEKCRERGIIIYRNDYNGAIGFLFGKEGFRAETVISSETEVQ